MDVPAILSAGAIGLGFLLAVLTYLLIRGGTRDTPVYVFMFFCFRSCWSVQCCKFLLTKRERYNSR
jgi:uncharacterized membrane protein SpoIIM required for sporulation